MNSITPEQRFNCARYESHLQSRRPKKLTPHLVWSDGSKEPIFINHIGWFQAGLYEAPSLDTFYLADLWDGLLDGIQVAMRKNENYMNDMFMQWANQANR